MSPELVSIIVLLCCSAFFSASETAFTSLTLMQIKEVQKKHRSTGLLLERLYNTPELVITTILIGNNIVNTTIPVVVTLWSDKVFSNPNPVALTAIITLLLLFFGEVTPKQIALIFNVNISRFSIRIIYALSFVFRPVILLFTLVSKLIGLFRRNKPRGAMSIDGLLHMVHHAQTLGLIDGQETRMIKGVLRFSDVNAHAIMTHRTDVFSLNAAMSLEAALPHVLESGYAQIPVYNGNTENVVGIIHEKNILRALCGTQDGMNLTAIMEPAVYVGENWSVQKVFQQLKHQHRTMAVVLDEYGGLSGIVTMNDLVSQIIGDLDEELAAMRERFPQNPDGSLQIPGEEPLYHLEELSGQDVPEARNGMNVAAYLELLLSRIPELGDRVESPLGILVVRGVSENRVEMVDFTARTHVGKDGA